MANKESRAISEANVIEAAHIWRSQPGRGGFGPSTTYDVIVGKQSYPPKAIASIANELAGNGELRPQDFPGAFGGKWHRTLDSLGFKISDKNGNLLNLASVNTPVLKNLQNDTRFKKSQRAFLVTGKPANNKINEAHVKKNRSGYWYFAGDREAVKGDALFILLPDPEGAGGYPRKLFGGLLSKNPVRSADGKVCFFVAKFHALHPVEANVKHFLGGVVPPQGDTVLTMWNGVAPVRKFKPAAGMDDFEESAFPEGKKRYKLHVSRERSTKLVRQAKARRMEQKGKLECEVCRLDFAKRYGPKGSGFIEGHHTIPVSTLKEGDKTDMLDLALVCSNCHSMLHRMKPLISVAELRELIATHADTL